MENTQIELIDRIVNKCRSGASMEDLSVEFGISVPMMRSLYNALRSVDIITEEDRVERKNNLRPKIAVKHNRSAQMVSKLLNEYELKTDYPMNLINMILGGNELMTDVDDAIKGLEFCLNEYLIEREKNILVKHFKKNMTLRKIGEELSLSKQRIHQIEADALRKLRNPKIIKYILYGYDGYRKMEEKQKEKMNLLNKEITINIDEVDFSVREYNRLKRANIQYLNEIESIEQLRRIRNLGMKSVNSIVNKLRSYGIEIQ